MKNILAAIMLMGATVSVDAMAPNAMQLNTTTLGIIDTAKQQLIAATQQARNSLFAWNKAAFNPCRQTRNTMLAHLDTLVGLFNQYANGQFVRLRDMAAIFDQQINDIGTCHTALEMWDRIPQSRNEKFFSRMISGKTKTQHRTTIGNIINAIHSACADMLVDTRNHMNANPIYRVLQNLPNATTASDETTIKGKCDEILGKLTLIDQHNRTIQQIENDLLTRLRQHVAGATLQDLELALDQNCQNLTTTQQAIRALDRHEKRQLAMLLNGGLGTTRLAKSGIQSAALLLIEELRHIPTQNNALRNQVCARLTQLVNAL